MKPLVWPMVDARRAAEIDPLLSPTDRETLRVLWQELSPNEWRSMKRLALARLLGVSERTAGRRIERLLNTRYLAELREGGERLYIPVNALRRDSIPGAEPVRVPD